MPDDAPSGRHSTRLYRISPRDVEATIANPAGREIDRKGNVRLSGETGDGRPILVVGAHDDSGFVVTVFVRADNAG